MFGPLFASTLFDPGSWLVPFCALYLGLYRKSRSVISCWQRQDPLDALHLGGQNDDTVFPAGSRASRPLRLSGIRDCPLTSSFRPAGPDRNRTKAIDHPRPATYETFAGEGCRKKVPSLIMGRLSMGGVAVLGVRESGNLSKRTGAPVASSPSEPPFWNGFPGPWYPLPVPWYQELPPPGTWYQKLPHGSPGVREPFQKNGGSSR